MLTIFLDVILFGEEHRNVQRRHSDSPNPSEYCSTHNKSVEANLDDKVAEQLLGNDSPHSGQDFTFPECKNPFCGEYCLHVRHPTLGKFSDYRKVVEDDVADRVFLDLLIFYLNREFRGCIPESAVKFHLLHSCLQRQ